MSKILALMTFFVVGLNALNADEPIADEEATSVCSQSLDKLTLRTADDLGIAWQIAPWRKGAPPVRYYNIRALRRIMDDSDLKTLAHRWFSLNKRISDSKLMNETYLFLVNIADLRELNGEAVENPDKPRPMVRYLRFILEMANQNLVPSEDIALIATFNSFFDKESGFIYNKRRKFERFVSLHLNPRLEVLGLVNNSR